MQRQQSMAQSQNKEIEMAPEEVMELDLLNKYFESSILKMLKELKEHMEKELNTIRKTAYEQVKDRRSVQFSSVAQSCPTLCDPMNRSTPGLPIHHQLLEFTQTHIHRVGDTIQLFHPLLSPSPPAPNPSQHQSLFQ